jgi:hypothetical protein
VSTRRWAAGGESFCFHWEEGHAREPGSTFHWYPQAPYPPAGGTDPCPAMGGSESLITNYEPTTECRDTPATDHEQLRQPMRTRQPTTCLKLLQGVTDLLWRSRDLFLGQPFRQLLIGVEPEMSGPPAHQDGQEPVS